MYRFGRSDRDKCTASRHGDNGGDRNAGPACSYGDNGTTSRHGDNGPASRHGDNDSDSPDRDVDAGFRWNWRYG